MFYLFLQQRADVYLSGGTLYICLAIFLRVISGEYEQREVYKRYNIAINGPDSVGETFCLT